MPSYDFFGFFKFTFYCFINSNLSKNEMIYGNVYVPLFFIFIILMSSRGHQPRLSIHIDRLEDGTNDINKPGDERSLQESIELIHRFKRVVSFNPENVVSFPVNQDASSRQRDDTTSYDPSSDKFSDPVTFEDRVHSKRKLDAVHYVKGQKIKTVMNERNCNPRREKVWIFNPPPSKSSR